MTDKGDDMITMSKTELQMMMKQAAREAVNEAFTQLGIDHNNPVEMQRDFAHLRDWRESVETAKSRGMLTVLAILTTGILGLIWMGMKQVMRDLP